MDIIFNNPPPTSPGWWILLLAPVLGAVVTVGLTAWLVTKIVGRKNKRWELRHQVEFRAALVAEMASAAHTLELAVAIHKRKMEKRGRPKTLGLRKRNEYGNNPEHERRAIEELDKVYIKSRSDGKAIESRLKSHFAYNPRGKYSAFNAKGKENQIKALSELDPWESWHAAMDCGTLLYLMHWGEQSMNCDSKIPGPMGAATIAD
jgi:hypothetical protein